MSQVIGVHPFRRKQFRTLSLLCDDEPLSDSQLKAYQSKLLEYRNFLDSVSRLALCGNVCVTEEAVAIGEHGLLTGESLNALQHAGAISVYNTLQQNNWEFPVSEDGEVAIIRSHTPVPDEFLDSEKPIRSDWPAVHISECFIEGERAKLHGSVRPLRTYLPPTVVFRNAADVDEDIPEPELNVPNSVEPDGSVELVPSFRGISVKKLSANGKEVEYIPLEDYYFGRQEGNREYCEEKGDFRFKCAVCQRIFYSNIKLMSHILGHVDETSQTGLNAVDPFHCNLCGLTFSTASDKRAHMSQEHPDVATEVHEPVSVDEQVVAKTASQLLIQRKAEDPCTNTNATEAPNNEANNTTPGSGAAGPWSCRICGKECDNELALAHHLQSTHRQREMPYVCRLCLFRSSLFEDILDHFKKVHDNSNHLLCTYCLRIFTPTDVRASQHHMMSTAGVAANTVGTSIGVGQTQVYLQHLRMHQVRHQLRRCPTCKLNFTNKSDYQVHRRLDHKATRDSAVDMLEDNQYDTAETSHNIVTCDEATDEAVQYIKETHPHVTLMNAPEAGRTKSLTSLRITEEIAHMCCLECDNMLGSDQHKKYLSCSMCRFGTYCASGYNRHLGRVHVYTSGPQTKETDVGMPMIRPMYFEWIGEEVREMDRSVGSRTSVVLDMNSNFIIDGSRVQPAAGSGLMTAESGQASVSPGSLSSVTAEVTYRTGLPESVHTVVHSVLGTHDTQTSGRGAQSLDADELGVADLLATSEEAAAIDVTDPRTLDARNLCITTQPSDFGETPAAMHNNRHSINLSGMETAEPKELIDESEAIIRYMSSRINARRFACTHCAISDLDGNSLARHLVEECGTTTVTINPNPELVKARQEAEEQYRAQIDQQAQEQNEGAILFEASDMNAPGLSALEQSARTPCDQIQPVTGTDVIMMGVDPNQLASYALMEQANEETLTNDQLATQIGSGGTTIDVTDANGEVVQQFIIPDDLQLEEGQTLVVIQDETGQPQLAIVNQADLLDPNSGQMIMQTEGDSGSLLLYTNAMEDATQSDSVLQREEDEKENNRYMM